MSDFILFLLFLAVIGLGVSLRRAFVHIDELSRLADSLRGRLTGTETALAVMRRSLIAAPPSPAPVLPQAAPSAEPAPVTLSTTAAAAPAPPSSVMVPPPTAPAAPVPVARSAAPPRPRAEAESLESQIGSKWLLYIGVIAIVIGVAYFEKWAIDKNYFGETARVIQGAVLGLALTYGGLRFVRAGYSGYGQMITGGGTAILYLSTYAAFNFYHLIDRPVAFVLMVGITAAVAWLADHLQSQGLALFAVGGGFLTPFLLPGNTDAQVALFGYDAILIAGAMVLSHRRNWPALNIVSYLFTLMTVAGWADRFYTSDKYLRTELFITLYCAMFLYIARRCRKAEGSAAEAATMALWTAPAAYYAASFLMLYDHGTAFLVWLVALTLVGAVLSDRVGTGAGLGVWTAVAVPLLMWTGAHTGPAWRVADLVTIAAVYLITVVAQLRRPLLDASPPPMATADVVWLHLNGLLMFAGAYFVVDNWWMAITGSLALAFAVCQGLLAFAVLRTQRDRALHLAALAFTLLSIAIGLQFDGPAVTIGWAAEGAAVVILGLYERRDWLRLAGGALFTVAFGLELSLLVQTRPINETVLFNPYAASAAAVAALAYLIAWVHHRDRQAPDRELAIGPSLVIAQIVTLGLLTSEIYAYWARYGGHFAREVMVSVTWGLYATVLIVVGLRNRYAPIRYFAMVVFAITIVKVFFLDMAELDRIYRVSSIIGLGILLLITSYLYSRSRREPAIDDLNGRS